MRYREIQGDMDWNELQQRLRRGFEAPLPGPEGQLRLSPRPRRGWQPGARPEGCRRGAGLVLVYPSLDGPRTVLTVRDHGLPHHPGQVSLPGGAVEDGESLTEAALREAHEEVGLEPDEVEIVGELSPLHIPVSKFVLHPVVGLAAERPEFHPEEGEVARILEVPLEVLRDPETLGVETREHGDRSVEVPYLEIADERVWGATAMILSEFLTLLGFPPEPPEAPDRG
ncbi:MAG: CoA pyrophosphatase [bacterium]|nr:CoA pyrophosphatase [bacterium]